MCVPLIGGSTPMPKLLRAEVVRLHQAMRTTSDPVARRKLAERAMELAQEAEAIADLPPDAEGLNGAIAHYRHMLANRSEERRVGKERRHEWWPKHWKQED